MISVNALIATAIGLYFLIAPAIMELYYSNDQALKQPDQIPKLAVDKHVAVVMPLPMYIFVTPKMPELRDRLEKGLKTLIANGWLDELINEVYGDDVRKADLKNRLIFNIDNPNVSKETTPFEVEEYWFKP